MARLPTQELLAQLIEEGSWETWDTSTPDATGSPGSGDSYTVELRAAAESTGVSESIRTGLARIGNHEVTVIASDFDFLAGSIGRDAAHRIIAAFDRATSLGLPVVGLPTSGGTRMQEGTPAFLLMAAIAAAVERHKDAGLPYLVYLRHPTTGGVFATWGSLGDVTFVQHDALVGFLGPRVFEALYEEPFPEGVQTGEGLQRAGVVDGVVEPTELRILVIRLLDAWTGDPTASIPSQGTSPGHWKAPSLGTTPGQERLRDDSGELLGNSGREPEVAEDLVDPGTLERDGWASIQRTRDPERPGLQQLLEIADGVVTLSGTQEGEIALATVLAVVQFDGRGCVVVGQDRSAQESGHLIGPADLRVSRRAMRLAERWGLPLLTVIDTQGGELSPRAELGSLAGEIARCLAQMSAIKTPTISLLLGGGGGGAALALLPADRVLAVADSWVTPLPAEGAAVIRYRTVDRADDMARGQSITAADLEDVGAVDRILPSIAANSPEGREQRMMTVANAVGDELARASERDVDVVSRAARWHTIGGQQPT